MQFVFREFFVAMSGQSLTRQKQKIGHYFFIVIILFVSKTKGDYMSVQSCNNDHDLFLFRTAYRIGEYIQSLVTQDRNDSGTPFAHIHQLRQGPLSFFNQTTQGLALEEYSQGVTIHTPFGRLTVLQSVNIKDVLSKIFEKIRYPLGLELIHHGTDDPDIDENGCCCEEDGPVWAITKWEGEAIEMTAYRKEEEFIPHAQVTRVWEKFKADRTRDDWIC